MRENNIKIFKDTMNLCNKNNLLQTEIKNSINNQQIILENDNVELIENKYETPAQIIVSKQRSFEAAQGYSNQKICVHNFASATNPGGGVERGSSAQEECLCRTSTLFSCLKIQDTFDRFYIPHRKAHNQLYNDDCIYTPDIIVFKTDTANPELLPQEKWYKVNVITCAAPNLRTKDKGVIKIKNDELQNIHEKRLRRILDIACANENEVVILGAFGCGAFLNNPTIVANAFKNVLKDYMYKFKTIHLAIYCNPKDETNYNVFKQFF